jgi:hypothetical protein
MKFIFWNRLTFLQFTLILSGVSVFFGIFVVKVQANKGIGKEEELVLISAGIPNIVVLSC